MRIESTYCEQRVNIPSLLNISLQESFGLAFIILLTIRFWVIKVDLLRAELLQNIIP
jgi:hypothetical protein